MKVNDIVGGINATVVHLEDGERAVTTGYCGDFLSFVMGNAPDGCCWFTVMNNVNVAAVATLAGVAVTVLCEGAKADEMLIAKARQQGINLLETPLDIFTAALKLFSA